MQDQEQDVQTYAQMLRRGWTKYFPASPIAVFYDLWRTTLPIPTETLY